MHEEPECGQRQQTDRDQQKSCQTALGIGIELSPSCGRTNSRILESESFMILYNSQPERRRHLLLSRSALILGVQLLPGILLVLLGWGFDDLSAFFLNAARSGLVALVLAGVLTAVLIELDFNPLRKGSTPVGNQSLQLGVLLIMSLSLLWFLPFADRRSILTLRHDYWRYLGLLLCCIGVTARLWALKTLGEYFSAYVALQPKHRLVRHGIYASIRHPLYLSLLLAPTGMALVFASSLALPILVLAGIFVLDRIRKEERLLAAHFGLAFEGYRRHTWKLVPFVL